MIRRRYLAPAVLILTLPVMLVMAACASGDEGLTRSEVEQIVRDNQQPPSGVTATEVVMIVREALAEHESAQMAPAPSGITADEVEDIVNDALDQRAQPVGVTAEQAEEIASAIVAGIPSKGDPAEYTKYFVDKAINRYETEGLNATIAYYSREASIDDQWYVFIIDKDDIVIAHPDPGRIGLDLNGWVGTDANGYVFGPEMLAANEEGKWVTYVYQNPAMAGITPQDLSLVDLKNAWVVRHDELIFASGWYIDVDEFTQDITAAITDLFTDLGLEGTIAALVADPRSVLGSVSESAIAYNTSGAVEGEWSAIIADPEGVVQVHFNTDRIGTNLEDLLGPGVSDIHSTGIWLTSEDMRFWAVNVDGWTIGAGWVNP